MEQRRSDRRPLMTAEELFDFPDDGRRYKLVRRELISIALSGATHSAIAARLAGELDGFIQAHDLGVGGA